MKVINVEKPKAAVPQFKFGDKVKVKNDYGGCKDVSTGEDAIVVHVCSDGALQVYGKDSNDYDYFEPEDIEYADPITTALFNLRTESEPATPGKVTVEFTFDELVSIAVACGGTSQAQIERDLKIDFPEFSPLSSAENTGLYSELSQTAKDLTK